MLMFLDRIQIEVRIVNNVLICECMHVGHKLTAWATAYALANLVLEKEAVSSGLINYNLR